MIASLVWFPVGCSKPATDGEKQNAGSSAAEVKDGKKNEKGAERIPVEVMPLALTPMNESLPNEEVARQFHDHFPVEEAAALVLLLAHERAPTTGETFVTGGGFTSRVALVMGTGFTQKGASPEALLDRFEDVMSLSEGLAPNASHEVRTHIIERLREAPSRRSGSS